MNARPGGRGTGDAGVPGVRTHPCVQASPPPSPAPPARAFPSAGCTLKMHPEPSGNPALPPGQARVAGRSPTSRAGLGCDCRSSCPAAARPGGMGSLGPPGRAPPAPCRWRGWHLESSPPVVARSPIPALPSGLPAAWHPGPPRASALPPPPRPLYRRKVGADRPDAARGRAHPRVWPLIAARGDPPAAQNPAGLGSRPTDWAPFRGSSPGAGRDLAASWAASLKGRCALN